MRALDFNHSRLRARVIGASRAPTHLAIAVTLLLGFLLIAVGIDAANLPVRFDRLSVEDGLSQSSVLSMLQDSEGFMWFGTEDGLNRFDGYQFQIYSHDPSNSGSLSDDYTVALAEDGKATFGSAPTAAA